MDLARGRVEDAIPRFEAAIRSHRAEGRISDEFLDRFALSYALLYNGRRFTEAREALDALGPDKTGAIHEMLIPFVNTWLGWDHLNSL
ncbi:hypothetical protein BE04_23385 [Sorangium cellulosum]|uniref:Tetratrico peptide repeat group 5 domain-containing protein n=1 Tax=Sorangium cellulosum TaxID=56 RepID=A0A150PBK5_SORCE|nr:hypothetical protein BE04_23385 [Sorangium cellulosum]